MGLICGKQTSFQIPPGVSFTEEILEGYSVLCLNVCQQLEGMICVLTVSAGLWVVQDVTLQEEVLCFSLLFLWAFFLLSHMLQCLASGLSGVAM